MFPRSDTASNDLQNHVRSKGPALGESYSLSVPEDQGRLDEAEKLYKAMEFVQCIAACSPAFATDPIPTEELSQTTALIPLDSKSPDLSHRAPDFPNMPRAGPCQARPSFIH